MKPFFLLTLSISLIFAQRIFCKDYYTVRRGDSLRSVAKRFKLEVFDLLVANEIVDKRLRVGQKLCIPEFRYYLIKRGGRLEDVARITKIPLKVLKKLNPTLVGKRLKRGTKVRLPPRGWFKVEPYYRYYIVKRGGTLRAVSKKTGVPLTLLRRLNPHLINKRLKKGTKVKLPPKGWVIYRVRKGDSLSKIARRFRVNPTKLKLINRLSRVKVGDYLLVPVQRKYVLYKVRKGDTLFSIAKKFRTSYYELIKLNRLKNERIYPGQILKIPRAKEREKYFQYRVKKGDSLLKIAKRFGVKLSELKKINHLKGNKIYVGQVLKIPRRFKTLKVKGKIVFFRLPVEGKIIRGDRGINIITECGKWVRSVEDGRVIYSGNDLKEFGNMVIVEHQGGRFYTLYAYNGKNLVKRSEKVEEGEGIALVGRNPINGRCMLHFEVRDSRGRNLSFSFK